MVYSSNKHRQNTLDSTKPTITECVLTLPSITTYSNNKSVNNTPRA